MRLPARLVLAAGALLVSPAAAHAAHRGALWAVVHACALNSRVTGLPWPCLSVDRREGVVVIGDPKRRTQVLVTPTIHITGIESPQLLAPGAPNYWNAAWSERGWLDRRAGRPGCAARPACGPQASSLPDPIAAQDVEAIASAIDALTPSDCVGYFNAAGYEPD